VRREGFRIATRFLIGVALGLLQGALADLMASLVK
jgi:hypothetical protein